MIYCRPVYTCILILLIHLFFSEPATAQEQAQKIRLYGYVVAGDSLEPQAGVVVYVPGTKRGTLTQLDGYFSVGVMAGDSVVISALGFESQFLKIPEMEGIAAYTLDIKLKPSVKELPVVNVMPWATERDLKQALLKLDLPQEVQVNTDFLYIKPEKNSILNGPPLDAGGNFKYFRQQQTQQRESRFRAPDVVRLFSTGIN